MNLTQVIYDRLSGDSTLTGKLATYEGNPAIFTAEPVPGDASLPYLVSTGYISGNTDVPEQSKQRIAARVVRDIRVYAEATGSMKQIEEIAERVWELFHRQSLSVTGWDDVWVHAERPIISQTDGYIYGMVVTITVAAVKQ